MSRKLERRRLRCDAVRLRGTTRARPRAAAAPLEARDQQAGASEPLQTAARDVAVNPLRSGELVGRDDVRLAPRIEQRIPQACVDKWPHGVSIDRLAGNRIDRMKISYLWKGLPGHPLHPPLTDATIGTYTFATIAAFINVVGIIDGSAVYGWWIALVIGLIITAGTATTGFMDWLTIEWGTPLWRTATWRW